MDEIAFVSAFLLHFCGWSATNYAQDIVHAAQRYDLDPRVLVSMMKQESDCDPRATGHVGEVGLMQLLPHTWATEGYDTITTKQLREPALNIMLGARHLHRCLSICGGMLAGALTLYSGIPKRKGRCRESRYSRQILARLDERRS